MPSSPARLTSTIALGVTTALSLAFAPAITASTRTADSSTGECLEGYAYVDLLGTPRGITSTWCVVRTDCQSGINFGPAQAGTSSAKAHYYVNVPQPAGLNVTCPL